MTAGAPQKPLRALQGNGTSTRYIRQWLAREHMHWPAWDCPHPVTNLAPLREAEEVTSRTDAAL